MGLKHTQWKSITKSEMANSFFSSENTGLKVGKYNQDSDMCLLIKLKIVLLFCKCQPLRMTPHPPFFVLLDQEIKYALGF